MGNLAIRFCTESLLSRLACLRRWAYSGSSRLSIKTLMKRACPVPCSKQCSASNSRLAIVTRFMCRMALKRRRTRAVKVIVGALSAFTNSNAICRYARRVNWSTRHLQAVVRRRMACMSSHLILLNRHWDKMYPPVPLQPTRKAEQPRSPPSPSAENASPPATEAQRAASAPPNSSKRPARKKGVGGQGGQRKGKGRQKQQQSAAGAGKKGAVGGNRSGRGRSAEGSPTVVAPDDEGSDAAQADETRKPSLYVCAKAKHEEIFSWLQRTRSKHCRDVINYERFTVRPLENHRVSDGRNILLAKSCLYRSRASGTCSRRTVQPQSQPELLEIPSSRKFLYLDSRTPLRVDVTRNIGEWTKKGV